MSSTAYAAALRATFVFAALFAPAIAPGGSAPWRHDAALAEPASDAAEKEAFEAAKELGTVEAWDAFLSNYSTGFRADLARAYVKKLGEAAPTTAPTPAAAQGFDYPMVAGSWGGIVRSGPGSDYAKAGSLEEGEEVTLMAPPTSVLPNDYPWFKIAYGDGQTGYMWGGILCSIGAERPDLFKLCTFTPVRGSAGAAAAPAQRKTETKAKGCSGSKVLIDGRCVKKVDAATHCGPGYRLKGNTCVQGYQEPKPQKQRPSWQIEAIKHGCKPGMGWNAQEGCHEND